jgi:DNA polymerase-3 subunit epsilon
VEKLGSFNWIAKAYAEGALFTAFDIETTGLDPKLDRIVEFGAIKFDRRGIMARYSTLVNPEIPMPAEASRVNGISDAMLSGKPVIEETLPHFLKFIQNTVIVAHNAPFDCGFVNESLNRLHNALGGRDAAVATASADERTAFVHAENPQGCRHAAEWRRFNPSYRQTARRDVCGFSARIVDTLVLSRECFPGRKSYSLQNLAVGLGIPTQNAHRAEDDALLCMEIFIKSLGS